MIDFYLERQPDERLKASFFEGFRLAGEIAGIKDKDIDEAIVGIFPDSPKKQIFEKPQEITNGG